MLLFPAAAQALSPTNPTDLTAIGLDSKVKLAWTAPQGATITKYQVRYAAATYVPDGTDWTDINNSSATTHEVTGLTNGTQYAFEIRAVNADGDGTAATTNATPVMARTLTYTFSDKDNTVTISASGSLDLRGFNSQHFDGFIPAGQPAIRIDHMSTWRINPPTQIAYREYVSLPNIVTTGRDSFENFADLSHMNNYSSNFHISLNTSENNLHLDYANFPERYVQIYEISDGIATFTGTLLGSLQDDDFHIEHTIGNQKIIFTTVEGATAPNTPTNLSATPGDIEAILSWTLPTSEISQVQVRWKATASLPFDDTTDTWTTLPATTTNHKVMGLTNGTGYTFAVRAINTAGNGAAATTTATPTATGGTPNPNPPTPPTVTITTSANELTAGETATVTVTFSEPVTGFVKGELIASAGSLSGFSGSGTAYTATLTPPANAKGTITLSVAAGVAEDSAGNGNSAAPNTTLSYNTITIATASQEALEQVNTVTLPDVIHNTIGHHVEVFTSRFDTIDPITLGRVDFNSPISMGLEEMGNAIATAVFGYGDELANGTVDWQQALDGRSFSFPAAPTSNSRVITAPDGMDDPTSRRFSTLTFWGRADYSSFSRELDHNNLQADTEGDTFTVHMGVDMQPIPKLVTGLALAFSRSQVDWDGKDGIDATYTVNFTTVHPYVSWFADHWQVWTSGLFGSGTAEWSPEGGGVVEENGSVSGLAGGVRFRLWSSAAEEHPLSLSLRLDGATASFLNVDAKQVRLSVEAARQFPVQSGELIGAASLGLRTRDDSTYGTGTAVEVGAGTTWQGERLAVSGQGRLLFGVGEQEWREWGISGTVLYSPGRDGEGVMASLQPSIGVTNSRMAELWNLTGSELVLGEQREVEPHLRAELAYGLRRGAALLTPYTDLSITPSSNIYGIGLRYDLTSTVRVDLHGSHTAKVRGESENSVTVDFNTQL